MNRPKLRRWWLVAVLGLLGIVDGPSSGRAIPPTIQPPPASFLDPTLDPIRRAATTWESRTGPGRVVVDQVCLVPDLSTFFQAIATWDRGHYFPILFDDAESSFRFIRAFQPARIVRMPGSGKAVPSGPLWERAIRAVGTSWAAEGDQEPSRRRGDRVPKDLGSTPPGVVLSSPDAPMLAGAVALAAGRFQPLIRLDDDKRFADVLSIDEADRFRQVVDDKVGGPVPDHDRLGDGCDFLTLAGDYPYRYRDEKGELEAVDDRVGRSVEAGRRWAFAGRLLGGAADSAYRAMCSLFLRPDSALMFNGYEEANPPWSIYAMKAASVRFRATLPTSQVSGDPQANLDGWHETFDPLNRFGLVLVNSHGSPSEFHLRGGPAHAPDIPRSVPTGVVMIHSFAAADPVDPSTVAGRWLANGAFFFFGSMNEPYLDAFRTPDLVGDLIARGLPIVVAARQMPGEARGQPWRLVFLGDPLYRIQPGPVVPRVDRWEPWADWPAYAESPRPPDGADLELFHWSVKTALARLQTRSSRSEGEDLPDTLLAIRRETLPHPDRPAYDALLIDVLLEARRRTALKARLLGVPETERSTVIGRALETLVAEDFQRSVARRDPDRVRKVWSELMKTSASLEFKQQATTTAGRVAEISSSVGEWRALLKKTLQDRAGRPDAEIVSQESGRVEASLKAGR